MFYLTTHSAHYSRLFNVERMIKDHSDIERGGPLLELLFSISSKGSFIRTILQDSTYHGLCYSSRGALAETSSIM